MFKVKEIKINSTEDKKKCFFGFGEGIMIL